MRGRYLKPRNAWEIAWNEALHSRDAVRAKKIAEELLPDPYKAAVNASDPERREAKVPEEEWYYEECRKYTQSELEDRKKLEEWETATCQKRKNSARNLIVD